MIVRFFLFFFFIERVWTFDVIRTDDDPISGFSTCRQYNNSNSNNVNNNSNEDNEDNNGGGDPFGLFTELYRVSESSAFDAEADDDVIGGRRRRWAMGPSGHNGRQRKSKKKGKITNHQKKKSTRKKGTGHVTPSSPSDPVHVTSDPVT